MAAASTTAPRLHYPGDQIPLHRRAQMTVQPPTPRRVSEVVPPRSRTAVVPGAIFSPRDTTIIIDMLIQDTYIWNQSIDRS